MNDYFDNLAARALGLMPAVRPRHASRFEPEPGLSASADFAWETASATMLSNNDAKQSVLRHAAPVLPPTAEPEPSKPPDDHRLRLAISPPQPEASAKSVFVPPPAMTIQPEPHLPLSTQSTLLVPPSVSAPLLIADSMDMPAATATKMPMPNVPIVPPAHTESRLIYPDIRPASPPQPGSALTPVTLGGQDQSAPQPVASESAPTIKITIGRVDVRAVMTPPAPTPRAAPERKPALSLDEYLKRRNTGGTP